MRKIPLVWGRIFGKKVSDGQIILIKDGYSAWGCDSISEAKKIALCGGNGRYNIYTLTEHVCVSSVLKENC